MTQELVETLTKEILELKNAKDNAYMERNSIVALLTTIYPSGIKKTYIGGWSEDWHNCVYVEFPWGQASWHYHDSHAFMFEHLPEYKGEWNGHTTVKKYKGVLEYVLEWRALVNKLRG